MSTKGQLRELLQNSAFKRFFVIRLLCQSGDGMFQAALATLFFFSPQAQGSPEGIAFALFVMLAPFTFVGPFVGVFIDRWSRRNIIVFTDAIRLVLTLAIIAVILTVGFNAWVYVLALTALSLNRFLLAALGASLPRVVPSEGLLIANSILPTIGAAATGLGAVIGVVAGLAFPAGPVRDAATLGMAVFVFAASVFVALGFGRDQLGPIADELVESRKASVGQVLADLGDAIGTVWRLRSPAKALLSMALMRLLYGLIFVSSILLARNYFLSVDGTGLASFAQIIGVTAVGFALAIFITPVVAGKFGEHAWIVACMAVGALSQLFISLNVTAPRMLVTAFFLGVATQGAKIAFDTIIQQDTPDEFRGRAFVLYDMLFNVAFMSAGLLGVLLLPDTGLNQWLYAVMALGYVAIGAAYFRKRPTKLEVSSPI